jgi:hypothetical protein
MESEQVLVKAALEWTPVPLIAICKPVLIEIGKVVQAPRPDGPN